MVGSSFRRVLPTGGESDNGKGQEAASGTGVNPSGQGDAGAKAVSPVARAESGSPSSAPAKPPSLVRSLTSKLISETSTQRRRFISIVEEARKRLETNEGLQPVRQGSMQRWEKLRLTGRREKRNLIRTINKISKSKLVKRLVMIINVAVIFFSNIIMVLETCDGPNYYPEGAANLSDYPGLLTESQYHHLEVFFTAFFSVEVVFRLLKFRSVRSYVGNFHNLIDWISILPLYLNLVLSSTSAGKIPSMERNVITLLKIVRVLKVGRHFADMEVLIDALRLSFRPLIIPMVFFGVVALLFSVILFFLNPCLNKDDCSQAFTDVFNALYFVIVSMMTVGYGDIVPPASNFFARVMAGVCMIFGSLYLAMPLAVIGNNFEAAWRKHTRKLQRQRVKAVSERLVAGTADISELKLEEDVIIRNSNNRLLETYFDLSFFFGKLDETVRAIPEKKIDSNQSAMIMRDIKAAVIKELTACIATHDTLIRDAKVLLGPLPEDIFCHLVRMFKFAKLCARRIRATLEIKKTISSKSKKKKTRDRRSSTQFVMTINEKAHKKLAEKMFILLELPQSSQNAMTLSRLLLFFNIMSVVVFFAQSMPELQRFGPNSTLCKELVRNYCSSNAHLGDPGCFVYPPQEPPVEVHFKCKEPWGADCYESGLNFGAMPSTNNCSTGYFPYGSSEVCERRQCSDIEHKPLFDGSEYWQSLEISFTVIFTVEILARAFGAPTWRDFFHIYNFIDMLSLVPSYYQFLLSLITGDTIIYEISTTGLNWNAAMKLLKFFRVIRLLRRFADWEILSRTFTLISGRLIIPLTFLTIFVFIGGYVEFQLEQGHDCFYYPDNPMCWDPSTDQLSGIEPKPGKRYLVNMFGSLSLIKDVAIGSWFSLYSMTTTGYGEVYPVTRFGRLCAIIMMIGGSAWNSMPLSLVGGEFYSIYSEKETEKRLKEMRKNRKSLWLDSKNARLWNQYSESTLCLQKINTLVEEIPDENRGGGTKKSKGAKVEPDELNDPDTVCIKAEILRKIRHVQLLHMKIIKIMVIAKQEGVVSDL